MNTFKEIANEDTIEYLVQRIGDYAAIYDQNLFRLLDHFSGGLYSGGLWVVREYENGAFAYIFPDSTMIPKVSTPNMKIVECSLEAASFAANFYLLNRLAVHAIEKGNEDLAEMLRNNHRALGQILSGRMQDVIDEDGLRPATSEELARPRQAHAEHKAIRAIID
jgi:hypothetical protein